MSTPPSVAQMSEGLNMGRYLGPEVVFTRCADASRTTRTTVKQMGTSLLCGCVAGSVSPWRCYAHRLGIPGAQKRMGVSTAELPAFVLYTYTLTIPSTLGLPSGSESHNSCPYLSGNFLDALVKVSGGDGLVTDRSWFSMPLLF